MRIESISLTRAQQETRIAAQVHWEDCERPEETIYFDLPADSAPFAAANPDAFLAGLIIPALYYGERRIRLDEEVCPRLCQGLDVIQHWLRVWYYTPERPLVTIEAPTRGVPLPTQPEARAGFFFSGGIDSYATVLANRRLTPSTHPSYIRSGLLIHGLEMDDPAAFAHVVRSLREAAGEMDIECLPVRTNLYLSFRAEDERNGFRFWERLYTSAALAAVGHLFAGHLSSVSIACDDDIPSLARRGMAMLNPRGNHPLLNPNFGSAELPVQTGVLAMTRLAKTKLVASSDSALRHLRVCNQSKRYTATRLNCGKCEKCLRTMLALESAGARQRTPAFAAVDLSPELVYATLSRLGRIYDYYYRELFEPLEARGRQDLVRAVQSAFRASAKNARRRRLRGVLKEFDQRYLGGHVREHWLRRKSPVGHE